MARLFRRLALPPALFVVCLVLAELVVRANVAWRGVAPQHLDRGVQREWSWALEHLRAGAAILPSTFTYDAELGWVTQPGLTQEGTRTNSAGMHATREFSVGREQGVPRLLFVGDSYTFGYGVDDEETFPAVLEREHLPGWDVLNLAVSGYGPDQIVLMYETRGRRYLPDVVVFGLYVRGFERMFSGFRSYAKPWFALQEGELQLHGAPVISPEMLYAQYASGQRRVPGWGYSYLYGSLGNVLVRELEDHRELGDEDERWRLFAALLRRFRDDVRADGASAFLLIIPNRPEDYRGSIFADIDRLARDEARRLGLPFLALAELREFSEDAAGADGSKPYRSEELGGHLSAHGNHLAARFLHTALRDAGLLAAAERRAQGLIARSDPLQR